MRTLPLFLLLLLPACNSVLSVKSAVPAGEAVDEPRLLGDWLVVQNHDTTALTVTQGPGHSYRIRTVLEDGEAHLIAELGPLGGDLWVLDVSAAEGVFDSIKQYDGLLLREHFQMVVRRRADGLDFGYFDNDSLPAALVRGAVKTPWIEMGTPPFSNGLMGNSHEIVMTGATSKAVQAAFAQLARRRGMITWITRKGRTLIVEDD